MRFLCLHGVGTNADIFELQTAPLRYLLSDQHEYEFVDGSLSAVEPAAGLEEVFGKQKAYYEHFTPDSAQSIWKVVQDVADFCEADGPFDGVWGFSQGGTVAATIMAARHDGILLQDNKQLPEFKIAVLFSATRPLDLRAAQSGQVQLLGKQDAGSRIHTTTVHFWDPADAAYPGDSEAVFGMCDPWRRFGVRHSAGHGIPPSSEHSVLERMAQEINEGIADTREG